MLQGGRKTRQPTLRTEAKSTFSTPGSQHSGLPPPGPIPGLGREKRNGMGRRVVGKGTGEEEKGGEGKGRNETSISTWALFYTTSSSPAGTTGHCFSWDTRSRT